MSEEIATHCLLIENRPSSGCSAPESLEAVYIFSLSNCKAMVPDLHVSWEAKLKVLKML